MRSECKDVRAFLDSVRGYLLEARQAEEQAYVLRCQCESITDPLREAVQNGSSDKHGDAILIALTAAQDKLRIRTLTWLDRVKDVEAFIERIPDPIQRTVLRLRYIECKKWVDVCEAMRQNAATYYEERYIYHIHGRALESARKLWEEDGR